MHFNQHSIHKSNFIPQVNKISFLICTSYLLFGFELQEMMKKKNNNNP